MRVLRYVVCVCLLAPLVAHAQVTARDTSRLGPMTVTATRIPVPAGATGVAITVVSGEQLRSRGITRVIDALRDVPSASVVQQSANGSLTALFLRGGESRYVKVLIDGVAVNEAGGAFDFGQLTTDNIDRIEIVRGPASVLWGSDAVAGVIQVFTRQGGTRTRLDASVRTGTTGAQATPGFTPSATGSRDVDLALSGGASALRWAVGGARHQSDGFFAFNNKWRNDNLSLSLRTAPGSATDLRLTARLTDATYQNPTTGSGAAVDRNAYRDEQRLTIGAEVGRRLTSSLEGRVVLSANELRAINANDPDSPADSLGFYSTNRVRVFRRAADARLTATLGGWGMLSTGLEYQVQSEVNDGTSEFQQFGVDTTRFNQRRYNTAAYASLFAQPVAGLSLNTGGRIDENSAFGRFLTLRQGVAYVVSDETRLRASVGTAFREPNFNENYSTAFTVGNPALKPEQTRSWEVGVTQHVSELELGATWFDQRFTNLIQYFNPGTTPGAPPAPNYANLASAAARGLELAWQWDPRQTSPLVLSGGWTWLSTQVLDGGTGAGGTFVSGQRLLRRPKGLATVTAGWRFAGAGSVQWTTQRVGQRRDRDFNAFPSVDVTLPGFTRHDVSVHVPLTIGQASTSGSALTLRIENVGGAQYQNVYGFAAPGRSVLVGLRTALDF